MRNQGFAIWLTGYSGAGKTTIANALKDKLDEMNVDNELLDGDIVRENLSKGLTFSKEDRNINVLRIGFVAELLARHGVCVIVSAISPYRQTRNEVREKIGKFVEVFVNCSLEECEKRDVKGLYKKARQGKLTGFTGIDDPYEIPTNPEVVCNTEFETLEESVEKIIRVIEKKGYMDHLIDTFEVYDAEEQHYQDLAKDSLISK